jgi:sulfonate transport system permease protein
VTTTPIRQQERSHVGTPTGTTEEHSHVRLARLAPRQLGPVGLAIGPLAALVLWQVSSSTGLLPPQQLASPWTAVTTGWEMFTSGELLPHLAASAKRAYLGLALGTVLGLGLALASGLSRAGEASIDSLVQVKRAIPTLALIPLAILWLGIGETMKVAVIATSVLVPIYINTHAGLRGIDHRYVELAQTTEMGRTEFVRRVALPGALPGFLTGLRLAVTMCWTALVVLEQINATEGIGYVMNRARDFGQTDVIVVGLVVYAAMGLLSDGVVKAIQRRALSYRKGLGS